MKDSEIVYSLSIADIQQVAVETLGRALSEAEILTVVPTIEENLPWFEIVARSIESVDGA